MSAAQLTILELILGQVNGASIISLDTTTIPTLLGGMKNPMKGRVRKHGIAHNVMLFQNKNINGYDAMVRRRLDQEGKDGASFQLSPRSWGVRVPNMPIVEHNGAYYLEAIFIRPGDTYYTLDGDRIEPQFIQGLNEDKQEAEQGGLERKVFIRTFKFDSIDAIRIAGQEYTFRA